MIIIDQINQIQFDPTNPPLKNIHAINFLPAGLFELASTLRILEIQKYNESGMNTFEILPTFPPIVPCIFHWFSASAVNYVQLISLIETMHRNNWTSSDLKINKSHIKKDGKNYLNKVIPNVYKWRDKVAAHFAATDPRADDNLGMLEQSVMASISFHSGRYWVGSFSAVVDNEQAYLPEWSVTETYEVLCQRYWNESKLPTLSSKGAAPNHVQLSPPLPNRG